MDPRSLAVSCHRFLHRRCFYALFLCTILGCAMLAARFAVTETHQYRFLIWNIFLAWVPYCIAMTIDIMDREKKGQWRWLLLAGGIWLIFFPNAPYLVTDFVHLTRYRAAPIWYDIGLLAIFVWTGCCLGIVSLQIMHERASAHLGRVAGWGFVLVSALLSGIGVYVGRFLRWNSWHVLTEPDELLGTIVHALADPLSHERAIAVSLMFAVLLLASYLTFQLIADSRKTISAT
jgi:uncharacterized membrane protein